MAKLKWILPVLSLLSSSVRSEVFDYTADTEPTIICQVLRLCDLRLEQRERITSVMIGDNVRWNINQFKTGSGHQQVQHLTIKPLAVNLTTSLVIGTNRRAYHLILKSSASRNMTQVSFNYQDQLSALNFDEEEGKTVPAAEKRPKEHSLLQLDTDYLVEGDPQLQPEQVYNDGLHTYIKMPVSIRQHKLPALLAISKEGGLFSAEKKENLNYRTLGTTYMLDLIPDHLILLLDTGDEEKRVDIYHTKKGV